MKKAIILFVSVITIWMFASWCDIVADNTKPNPEHSKYNFFCMMFAEEIEKEGYVADAGIVVDCDGETWEVETKDFAVGDSVYLTIEDKGTPQLKDDEVIEVMKWQA